MESGKAPLMRWEHFGAFVTNCLIKFIAGIPIALKYLANWKFLNGLINVSVGGKAGTGWTRIEGWNGFGYKPSKPSPCDNVKSST